MSVRRPLLRPLVPLYAAAVALKHALRSNHVLPVRRLPGAVISVGSLSAGGAGKTPVVLSLAKALSKRDYDVRILTRGYGRKSKAIERVDPSGHPDRFGDEPLLLAQRSGVPVFVGADRHRAALLARDLPTKGRIVYLLDDGFQHRRLARDLDLLLLTAQDVRDTLLPAGNLREPLSRLSQADVLVIREEEREALQPFLNISASPAKAPEDMPPTGPALWQIQRRLEFPDNVVLPQRPVVFCAVARPAGFTTMLAAQGVTPAETVTFVDHHPYTAADIDRLCQKARQLGADGFVTTEKDLVKLRHEHRDRLQSVAPLLVARLEVDLLEERVAIEQIIRRVSQMNRRRRPPGP